MKRKVLACILGAAVSAAAATAAAAATLEDVKQKGFVQCGVSQGLAGFSNPDSQNNWTGLDVDFCRAVAAAIFNDPAKVKFSPLSAKERFTALQSGEVDILSRNTTWTMSRDTSLGLKFAGVTYYDGQGFMVRKELGVKSALELDGATVCTNTGTTTELNLADYFKANGMKYQVVAIEDSNQVRQAYDEGRCDIFTTDQSGLYAERLALKSPDDHMVLPEIISKEPLGPVVRQGDDNWFNVVKWTYYALLDAEEAGITQANIDEKLQSADPGIQRMLGAKNSDGSSAGFGTGIGLDEEWVVHIIKAVGNYGEIFERNVGTDTPLNISRGKNALWTQGGLQYGMPIR